MREVISLCFPPQEGVKSFWDECKVNETEMSLQLPNESVIIFGGLEKSRMDRILGNKFSSIWVNECNDPAIDYQTITHLMTRLREKKQRKNGGYLPVKMFFDCNPESEREWTCRAFKYLVHPVTNNPHRKPEDWVMLKMNTEDNEHNLIEGYLENMKDTFAGRDYTRFVEGEWRKENENAIFKAEWINAGRHEARSPDDTHDDLVRIVVGVDPAGTSHKQSDESGIVVVGVNHEGECFVLEDCSGVFTPDQATANAFEAYYRWQADSIIVERNNGADWITHAFRIADTKGRPSPAIKTVWASRGKITRAEPTANLYGQGKVHHCGSFEKLEGQLEDFTIDYNRNKNGSPDRLDALVWAITELAVEEQESFGGSQRRVKGFMS